MNSRKAFTMIELLVVMGILLVLAGILLPVVTHVRRTAQISGQKADFVTISNALEAYKADFGDYPRNTVLPTWSTVTYPGVTPYFLSLTTALLGPGPAISQNITGGQFEVGDGSDGMGFRSQLVSSIPSTTGGVSLSSTPPTFSFSANFLGQATTMANGGSGSQAMILQFAATSTAPAISVGVASATLSSGSQLQLNIPVLPANASNYTTGVLSLIGGKVGGPYLPADTFKIAFVPGAAADGQPVMLDRWGQVIQYFPRYGPASNRTNDSSPAFPPNSSIQAGPLYGEVQPHSIDATNGQNALFDWRDGAPFFVPAGVPGSTATTWPNPVDSKAGAYESWPAPASGSASNNFFTPETVIQWMLGDTTFANEIQPGAKLNWDGPFILISTGPDGPERANGGYCSFPNPTTGKFTDSGGNPLTASELLTTFTNSGNIYNFDPP